MAEKGFCLTVRETVDATGGSLLRGAPGAVFTGVSTDSRKAGPGDLFIPLAGERFDGHDFIADAVRGGAAGFLTGRGSEAKIQACGPETAVICVEDTLHALGEIARSWRNRFDVPVAALTGSSGKTTTKEMAASIAGLRRDVLRNEGNFNNLVGLPLTILGMRDRYETAILEMGTNRRGEIARLTEIASPVIGLITNIGSAHLEGFGNVETVAEEKRDLFNHMGEEGIAVINMDDPVLASWIGRYRKSYFTYGFSGEAMVRAEDVRMEAAAARFTIRISGFSAEVRLNAAGRHNVSNALGAAALCWCMGIEPDAICEGIAGFRPVQGRMEIIALRNGSFVINDSYNANPESVRAALATLTESAANGAATTAVLGDMLELGTESERLHREIGLFAAKAGVKRIYVRGDFSPALAAGAIEGGMQEKDVIRLDSPRRIAEEIGRRSRRGDWVLVKGSRRMRMEEISQALADVIGITEKSA
ncbi:MAG: UDP-N-acetylmuramoyl-tripeptide--D-alanyl-D-alanine ligase [Syntrophales bacterium]|nr:UDP-N-acetylmuramoyl-tripeptide--D-alanyl-D-alanine ligase [Syntrophales bacterium]